MKKLILFIVISFISILSYAQVYDMINTPTSSKDLPSDSVKIEKHFVSRRLFMGVDSYDIKVYRKGETDDVILVAYKRPWYLSWIKKNKY